VDFKALATTSSALSMGTDIVILVLPFKYLVGMIYTDSTSQSIIADRFLSTQGLHEGKDPTYSLDESWRVVSLDLYLT
jgi:hypothetical protein